ncbi:AraC family transcriptional regulator [Bacterioplanes sanyensis]|uniref:helix-turn-helix transcriptional regulator n=1 Tax=Bacterioplanes sanyensis TaxID=1249553 RepID=UPI00167464A8|nr:AraC family transcriptional regulator [Bacterioplanes sanyensis]GGY48018.1 AraC family transcriptional regulator [Bacterioplanes sanyensis]
MKDQHIFWRDERLPHVELRLVKEGRNVCYAPHSHRQWSMGAIINGHSSFDYRDQQFDIHSGDLVLMNPQWVHVCNPISDAWGYWMLYVDTPWLVQLRAELGQLSGEQWQDIDTAVIAGPSLWFERYQQMANILIDEQGELLDKASALLEFLSDLFLYLAQKPEPQVETHAPAPQALNQVAQQLQHAQESAPTLAQLAQLAGCSEGHLVRAFKRQFGLAPHAYWLDQRIQQSKVLLRQGLSIAEVALASGFTDQAHFQRVFKKLTAATPGQFMRRR